MLNSIDLFLNGTLFSLITWAKEVERSFLIWNKDNYLSTLFWRHSLHIQDGHLNITNILFEKYRTFLIKNTLMKEKQTSQKLNIEIWLDYIV